MSYPKIHLKELQGGHNCSKKSDNQGSTGSSTPILQDSKLSNQQLMKEDLQSIKKYPTDNFDAKYGERKKEEIEQVDSVANGLDKDNRPKQSVLKVSSIQMKIR